jgi:hypothetical protein
MDGIKAIAILRHEAARKRDEAIEAARANYKLAMRLINDLALNLDVEIASPGKRRGNQRAIVDLIVDFMPKDRPFAMREVLAKVREAYPKREFNEPSFRTKFKELKDAGIIKQVRKEDRGFIVWAAANCPVSAVGPLAAVSIADAAERVLRDKGPMRQAEIVLAVQENGYRPDANRRTLYGTLTQAFKRNKHRFAVGTDGKWSAV